MKARPATFSPADRAVLEAAARLILRDVQPPPVTMTVGEVLDHMPGDNTSPERRRALAKIVAVMPGLKLTRGRIDAAVWLMVRRGISRLAVDETDWIAAADRWCNMQKTRTEFLKSAADLRFSLGNQQIRKENISRRFRGAKAG